MPLLSTLSPRPAAATATRPFSHSEDGEELTVLPTLTSDVRVHLHKKGILAQASAQEKGADRVPCGLHGLYDEAGPELQGRNRKKRQGDS